MTTSRAEHVARGETGDAGADDGNPPTLASSGDVLGHGGRISLAGSADSGVVAPG
ncbi:MAG TPA: hypothetical protein VIE19_02770 [Lapillicoccus sp.]